MSPLPTPSSFSQKVADTAQAQFDQFHTFVETDPELRDQIKKYWVATGVPFPGVETAWSAVFVSFCVKQTGVADGKFKFSPQHSVFCNDAINHPRAYKGVPINTNAVHVGDIIQNNRGGTSHDFQFAKSHSDYSSHSAVVVERGEDASGKFAITVGGNESNSVRTKKIRLNDDGTIKQRTTDAFICHLVCQV